MDAIRAECKPVVDFLKTRTAYDLLPESGKLVVLDVCITISSAFQAFVENGITSAPLIDSKRAEYLGMLTLMDFIEVLYEFYKYLPPQDFLQAFEIITLREWRKSKRLQRNIKVPSLPPISNINSTPNESGDGGKINSENVNQVQVVSNLDVQLLNPAPTQTPLIFVHSEASLFDSSSVLLQHHIHRGPVLDTDTHTVLHVFNHARILRLLVSNWRFDIRILNRTLRELKIGTYHTKSPSTSIYNSALNYKELYTLPSNGTVLDALKILHGRRISSIPILDEKTGNVITVFSSSDVRFLSLSSLRRNLELPILQLLKKRDQFFASIVQQQQNSNLNYYGVASLSISPDKPSLTSTSSSPYTAIPNSPNLTSPSSGHSPLSFPSSSYSISSSPPTASPPTIPPRLITCFRDDPLKVILQKLVSNGVHRLIVVSRNGSGENNGKDNDYVGNNETGDGYKLEGIVSVNDVLRFFVIDTQQQQQQQQE